MKKMTKGALVTGLGVALLLGGGGTLAVWNADTASTAGTVAAGDLNLTSGAGAWSSNISGPIANIDTYKVVPGETLTFTQNMDVTLAGNQMKAQLTSTGATAVNGFTPADVTVSQPVLSTGTSVLTPADSGKNVTATTTFTFNDRQNQARSGTNKTYKFGEYRYVLTQQAPSSPAN